MRPPRGSHAQSSHLSCAQWGPAPCPSAGATSCLYACQMRGDLGSGRGTCVASRLCATAQLCPGGGQGGGQQRPRPGSALSRNRLCRVSTAQGAFGKGIPVALGPGPEPASGASARPLASLCAFTRLAPGPGTCGAAHYRRGSQTPWGLTVSRHGPTAEPRTMCLTSPGPQFPSLSQGTVTVPTSSGGGQG